MTAKKKIITKSIKSPAPATKTAAPAAKKKVAAKAPRPAAAKPPRPVAPARVATAKPVAAKPAVTTITAKIDIGFGNALYVRGEGGGLSWDRGLLLSCSADDRWEFTLGESAQPFVFKFLVNDLTWSTGENYVVASGQSVTLTPEF